MNSDTKNFIQRDRVFVGGRDSVGETLSLDFLHRVPAGIALSPGRVDRNDIGVMERTGGFGFAAKPIQGSRIDHTEPHHLERDDPIE